MSNVQYSMTFSNAVLDCAGPCKEALPEGTEGQFIYSRNQPERSPKFFCKPCFHRIEARKNITVTNSVTNGGRGFI